MRNSIISLILLCSSVGLAPAATTADLAEGAPERYTVVPGDTLWGIASRFLKSPWKWGELWRLNRAQIRNPHRIYPGDVIVLDRSGRDLGMRVVSRDTVRLSPRAYETPLEVGPIPTIPPGDIEPFLSKPLVITADQFDRAARIVATQESRVVLGAGNVAYVEGVTRERGEHWQLFRPGIPLVDPTNNEVLGYEAVYLGDARVLKFGPISTIEIVKSKLETTLGDRLVPLQLDLPIENYVPRPPSKTVEGRIIAAYGALYEAGPNSVVTLSKGARDGLEVGHVLAIHRNLNATNNQLRESALWGRTGIYYNAADPRTKYINEPLRTRDSPIYGRQGLNAGRYKNKETHLATPVLPDERYGLLMVFRVFERASYALVLNADRPVAVLDFVSNP